MFQYAALGQAPTAASTAEAWAAYVTGLRDKVSTSKAAAVAAYSTLKQVRSNVGLPFITGAGGEAGGDTGGWSSDLEQQAVDLTAMANLLVAAADDVLAGKRKLMWDDQQDDFAIEGFGTDVLRLQRGANGSPVLVDASGTPQHVAGQVGVLPAVVFGAVVALALVQALLLYLIIDQALKTLQTVAEQKTERTVAEAAKKHADLVAQGKATPEQAAQLNKSIYSGATELAKAHAESAKSKGFESKTLVTLGYVALGLGALYVIAKFATLGGERRGGGGMPLLAPARAANPRSNARGDINIANPCDAPGLLYGDRQTLFYWSLGAYGDTHVYTWADSYESAEEEMLEWVDDNAPGLLSWAESEEDEVDMIVVGHTTLKHGNIMPSWEVHVDEVGGAKRDAVKRVSALLCEDEGALPLPANNPKGYPYEKSPTGRYILLRDGSEVMRGTEQDVWGYIHKNHSYSVEHALKYEGYHLIPDNSARRRANPRREPADEQAAEELELYIENDARFAIHGQGQGRAISQNLWKKWKKGTYDSAQAPKAWSYVVESAAKAYAKEFSSSASDWKSIFNPATRDLVANSLTDTWEEQAKAGEFDRYSPAA